MGFLSGVLGAVKNENEVTTYDNKDGNDINKLISDLNTNIGSGRAGLAASVTLVKRWLEGYEREVKERTKKVVDELSEIIRTITADHIAKFNNPFNDSLQTMHKNYQMSLTELANIMSELKTNPYGFAALDKDLKSMLIVSVDAIETVIDVLIRSAGDEELTKQARRVDMTLMEEKKKLCGKIRIKIGEHWTTLDGDLKKAREEIEKLNNERKQHFKKLYHFLNYAKIFLEHDLHNEYREQIDGMFLLLRGQMGAITHIKSPGKSDKCRLEELADSVRDAIAHLNTGLNNTANKLGEAIDLAVREVTGALKTLDGKVQKDLHTLNERVDAKIERIAMKVEPFLESFKKSQSALKKGIQEVYDEIRKFQDLQGFDKIGDGLESSVPLLKAIKEDKAFITLKEYLSKLDTDVMTPVKEALAVIGEWWEGFADYTGKHDLDGYLRSKRKDLQIQLQTQLHLLTTVADPNDKNVDVMMVRIPGIEGLNIEKLSLKNHTSSIENIVHKFSSQPQNIKKDEVRMLLTDLGKIAEAVSDHSDTVVQKVTESIGNKLTGEISSVAAVINNKVFECNNLAKNSDAFNLNVIKGFNDSVSGLPKLVSEFVSNIQQPLSNSKDDVRQTVFMKITGVGANAQNYDLQTAMPQYYKWVKEDPSTATESIYAKIGDITNKLAEYFENKIISNRSTFSFDSEHFGEYKRKRSEATLAITEVLKTINELERLPAAVDAKRSDAGAKMKELKTELSNKFNAIYDCIRAAETALDAAIQSVENTTRTAFRNAYEAVDHLRDEFLAAVGSAFSIFTDDVRKLFAETRKTDLTALRSLVDTQVPIIHQLIREQTNNGLKGMLKLMKGNVNRDVYGATQRTTGGKVIGENLLDLIREMLASTQPAPQMSQKSEELKAFPNLSTAFQTYVDIILAYVKHQAMTPVKTGALPTDQSEKVRHLKDASDSLLHYLKHNGDLTRQYLFDHNFVDLLASLNSVVTSLSPSFSPCSPLLAPLKRGLSEFAQQLGHAYVNRYSGEKRTDDWVVSDNSKPKDTPKLQTEQQYKLTPEGRNCAKVCLTIVEMVMKNIVDFLKEYNTYKSLQINKCEYNLLGDFFHKRGYEVNTEKGKQTGELQDKDGMRGEHVYNKITAKVTDVNTLPLLQKWRESQKRIHPNRHRQHHIHLFNIVDFLQSQVVTYYKVRHLEHISSPKQPCNIYQMLQWLCGIQYYPSVRPLFLCFKDLFPKSKEDEGKELTAISPANVKLSATTEITYAHLASKVFVNVCLQSHSVLTAILGRGHAGGRYAVDFKTNEAKLLYPSKASDCFDMLVDIAYRVQHQLYFLFQQFYFESSYSSWRDCLYGRGVAGSSWKCNTKQCPNHDCNQTARQKGDQMGNQKCDQHCDQYPMCDLKSPLQSFLEDGLQGFLPHQFTKPGCKLECATANHKAIPCKTPMGFGDISNMASHTQKGTHLRDVLIDFCGNVNAPLTLICAYFNCLLQRPPQNLGDMFAFYYNLLRDWNRNDAHKKEGIDNAVAKANFENQDTTLELADLFATHNGNIGNHAGRHLSSLVNCDGDDGSNCGRYLKPISTDVYTIYSSEYADKYVSWIVYLTETFYDLLKKLYEECKGNCGPKGSNCHNKCCVNGCPSLEKDSRIVTHDKDCQSIVPCKYTLPTLCRYGFTFWYQTRLNGEGDVNKKRTCKDFCSVLEKVLSDKEKDRAPLAVLIYETIPNFLFKIRAPFIWLNVALWSLSLFYLICVMVGRLDVLHIRSHLRSPASHRITAQSLLAAAQVGRLAKISYLQP